MNNNEDGHVGQSIDYASVFRDGGEQCASSPLIYGFSYSPERDQNTEYLSEVLEEEVSDPLISTIDATSNTSGAKSAVIFNSHPIGKISRGKVDISHGFFNEYWYESQEYAPQRLLKAHRVICGFEIYAPGERGEECVGYLKSNLFGTRYVLHQDGEELMEIRYTTSLFKRRGPRAFSVSFSGTDSSGDRMPVVMRNKEPYYNVETNSYSLNFNGRVTTPSVKNFQLIHPLDPTYVTLTFGKVSKFRYILDYTYPWSGIQAFAIALAALDYKIGCD